MSSGVEKERDEEAHAPVVRGRGEQCRGRVGGQELGEGAHRSLMALEEEAHVGAGEEADARVGGSCRSVEEVSRESGAGTKELIESTHR